MVACHQFGKTVGLDKSLEEGEALPDIEIAFISVHVNASDFDVVARPRHIDIVSKKHHLFTPGNTTRQNLRGRLLNSNFLIVSIDGPLFVDGEGTSGLARGAAAQSDVVDVVDVEGSFGEATFDAFVYYLF